MHGLLGKSLTAGLLLCAMQAHAGGQIECSSRGYKYSYCQVDTQGSARLAHRQSGSSCDEGRSWGYDQRGIWVDDGCSAIFEYGYGGGRGRDDGGRRHKDNTGKVVAGVAALAILGAIMSSDKSDRHGSQHDYGRDRVPNWAVGGFSGSDRDAGNDISINVDNAGRVAGYYGRNRLDGQIDGARAYLGNRGYSMRQTRDGFSLESDDGRTVLDFYRD